MCTTILILGPLVLLLRRRFCNKVEPYVLSCPLPSPQGSGAGDGKVKGGLGWRISLINLWRFMEIFGFLLVLVLWMTPADIRFRWVERSLL